MRGAGQEATSAPTRHLSPEASLDKGGAIATEHLLLSEDDLMGHAGPSQEEGVGSLGA